MAVGWSSVGHLVGDFGASLLPEVDAFRITGTSSGGAFTGDYPTDVPGYTSWSFDFLAEDILPSGLNILINLGGGTLFQRSLLSQVVTVGQWNTITVSLQSPGWFGGTSATFSNGLAAVNHIDIQVTRNGSLHQSYFLDNFSLNGDPTMSVPEPSTAALFILAFAACVGRRRGLGTALRMAVLSAGCAAAPLAHAASPWTESFTGGAAGWTNAGNGTLEGIDGALRVSFAFQAGPPPPETARLVAGAGASGGVFTGDYVSAGIVLVGFRVLASNAVPSKVDLVWERGGDAYNKALGGYVTETGRWYSFVVCLSEKSCGPWIGPGDHADFLADLSAVDRFAIEIRRSSADAQVVLVDDVFIAEAPRSTAIQREGNAIRTVWSPLPVGATIALETADLLPGTWTQTVVRAAAQSTETFDVAPSTSASQRVVLFTD